MENHHFYIGRQQWPTWQHKEFYYNHQDHSFVWATRNSSRKEWQVSAWPGHQARPESLLQRANLKASYSTVTGQSAGPGLLLRPAQALAGGPEEAEPYTRRHSRARACSLRAWKPKLADAIAGQRQRESTKPPATWARIHTGGLDLQFQQVKYGPDATPFLWWYRGRQPYWKAAAGSGRWAWRSFAALPGIWQEIWNIFSPPAQLCGRGRWNKFYRRATSPGAAGCSAAHASTASEKSQQAVDLLLLLLQCCLPVQRLREHTADWAKAENIQEHSNECYWNL